MYFVVIGVELREAEILSSSCIISRRIKKGRCSSLEQPEGGSRPPSGVDVSAHSLIDRLIFIDLFTCSRRTVCQTAIRCFMKADFYWKCELSCRRTR